MAERLSPSTYQEFIHSLCADYQIHNSLIDEARTNSNIKRGLRNADGSGVLVGLTTISNVHGYNKTPDGVVPDEGDLIYRGYHIADLIDHAQEEDRFGYEEAAYL